MNTNQTSFLLLVFKCLIHLQDNSESGEQNIMKNFHVSTFSLRHIRPGARNTNIPFFINSVLVDVKWNFSSWY